QLVQIAEIEVRDRLVGHERDQALEFDNGLRILRVLLVGDAEVEPGMRNLRVLALRALELRNPLFRSTRFQQRQAVVDPLARRLRREIERLLEFVNGELLRRWILVEGLAEITMMPERVGGL